MQNTGQTTTTQVALISGKEITNDEDSRSLNCFNRFVRSIDKTRCGLFTIATGISSAIVGALLITSDNVKSRKIYDCSNVDMSLLFHINMLIPLLSSFVYSCLYTGIVAHDNSIASSELSSVNTTENKDVEKAIVDGASSEQKDTIGNKIKLFCKKKFQQLQSIKDTIQKIEKCEAMTFLLLSFFLDIALSVIFSEADSSDLKCKDGGSPLYLCPIFSSCLSFVIISGLVLSSRGCRKSVDHDNS